MAVINHLGSLDKHRPLFSGMLSIYSQLHTCAYCCLWVNGNKFNLLCCILSWVFSIYSSDYCSVASVPIVCSGRTFSFQLWNLMIFPLPKLVVFLDKCFLASVVHLARMGVQSLCVRLCGVRAEPYILLHRAWHVLTLQCPCVTHVFDAWGTTTAPSVIMVCFPAVSGE